MKKIVKRVIPDRNVWIVSAILAVGIQTIHLGLFVGRNLYSLCLLDMYAMSDLYSGYILYPLISVLEIYILRNEFSAMQIIREKSLFQIWCRVCMKLALTGLFLAVVSTLYLGGLGLVCTKQIFSWDQWNSAFAFVNNALCREIPVWYVIILYMSHTFISSFFSMLLPLFTFWVFHSYSMGILVSAVFWYSSNVFAMPYMAYSGCRYSAIAYGFDWKYQFQIPYGIVLVLFFAGALLLRQRDFLSPKKEGI